MLEALPWSAYKGDRTRFWVHYALCIVGFLLAVITLAVQWAKPATYGRHAKASDQHCGPMVHQRIAHTLSDAAPGVLVFLLVFFFYGNQRGYANITFTSLWLCHYIHRGLIHPWIMRYSDPKTPLGIPLGGLFPNLLYSFLNADWLGHAKYVEDYYKDPRFIIGILFFITGFCINRYSDFKLRQLRSRSSGSGYTIPRGCLFEYISCPNYFGEMLEWLGWALSTWSAAGLVWCLFGCGTFIPRARHNHQWNLEYFPDYPQQRKALIPLLY